MFGLLLMLPLLVACIGRATPPEQVKLTQAQNEVLGKFARQVGENELNILLKDPNDAMLPGIPVGDLLYILGRVNPDKLIRLVKGVTATTTLELILAIKRVGCTRYAAIFGGTLYDARILTGSTGMNACSWQQFHVPNVLTQLLNGTNDQGLQSLIDTVKHSYTNLGLPANKPLQVTLTALVGNSTYDATVSHYPFLMKLAYIVAGFDTPTGSDRNLASGTLVGPPKLYNLMNLTTDGRDMVFLLDSFDKNACPGVASTTSNCVYVDAFNVVTTYDADGNLWNDIAANQQVQGLQNLLSIMAQVTDTAKMGTLVNGRRTARYNLGQDEAQVRYYIDRLKVVLEHDSKLTKPVACYDSTPLTLYNTAPGTAAERQLQDYDCPQGGTSTWNAKLSSLINRIGNIERMMDLVYAVDDGWDTLHNFPIAFPAPNRGLDNLLVLINNLNDVTAHINNVAGTFPTYTDPTNAAAPPPADTTNTELRTAAYLIDNVTLDGLNANPALRNKVKYLVEYIGDTRDVLQLACYSAVTDNASGAAQVCDARGLINLVADSSKLGDRTAPNPSPVDYLAAGRKLVNLAEQITSIEDMRFLLRKVTMFNMTEIIKGLRVDRTTNVANLVNQLTGRDCWSETAGATATTITNPGTTAYTSRPSVGFSGGGAGATARAVIETDSVNFAATLGQVKAAVVINAGLNYSGPLTLTFTGGGGSGAAGTFSIGRCNFNPPIAYRGFPTATATGATGLGKLVNVINHITGTPGTIVTLINGVTDGLKLGLLINGTSRSSNLVGIINAVLDPNRNNNADINDLIALMNTLSREDVLKLVHLLENLSDAREIDAQLTVPGGDHDMVAQLMAPYNAANIQTTSGLGTAALAELIALLRYNGGSAFPAAGGNISIGMSSVATYATTSNGLVSGIQIANPGVACGSAPTVSITGGGGSGATASVVYDSVAQQVARVTITNAGTGYTSNPTVTFAGGGCSTAPTANAFVNRVGSVSILDPAPALASSQNCDALPTTTPYCVASGAVATLRSYYGGSGYNNGQVCPIVGAGGNGATCTVVSSPAVNGALTGCSAIAGGLNYAHERIVKIGGRAEAAVTIVAGVVTGISVTHTGCGYAAPPTIEVVGCTTAPTFNVTAPGGRVNATVATGGSGCPVGAKVVIGENPFAPFSDGASAIVNTITGGRLTFVSMSEPAVNAAQLIQLIDRDATGITSGTRGFSITYNGTTPGISAREAMVRLLHHGVTIAAGSAKGYFSENYGLGSVVDVASDGLSDNMKGGLPLGGAGVWTNAYAVNLPGLGPRHIAGSILNSLGGVEPTQTLINMVNANTVDLTDTLLLLGCGDRSTYTNASVTAFTWQQLCTQLGPGLW